MSFIRPINSENSILFHLLKPDSGKTAFTDLVKSGIDWDLLIDLCQEHRVLPLVFKKLKSEYPELIAKETLEKFLTRYQETAKFNFARSSQLIELVACLQSNDIPVIAYKGMALAKWAFNDVSLRQFGDIDLLIRKDDFANVKELFIKIGCKPAWDLNTSQEKAVLRYYYEYPFFYGEINTLVEVHWEFLESFFAFDIDLEEVWGRSVDIDLYGKQIKTLSAEDYVVILCTHGSKHFWKRLSWICDIAKLVENTEIDWVLVRQIAITTGSLRMVLLGLHLTDKLLNTEIPSEMREEISKEREVSYLGDKIENFLLGVENEPAEWTEVARIHLRMREKIGSKIKYFQRLLGTKLTDKLFMPMGRPR